VVRLPTLLLGGTKTPVHVTSVPPMLTGIIPGADYEIVDGLGTARRT
jgi:hypothetical protein